MNIQVKINGESHVVTDVTINMEKREIVYDLLGNHELRMKMASPTSLIPLWYFDQKLVHPEVSEPTGDGPKTEQSGEKA